MTVSPVPGVVLTAFQKNAFQNNAFEIGSGMFIFQPGSKGRKHKDDVLWVVEENFEDEHEAVAILLLFS